MSDITKTENPSNTFEGFATQPTSSKTDGDKPKEMTLKLNANYTSMGPRSLKRLANTDVTKAAGKVLNQTNLKIKVKNPEDQTQKTPVSHEPMTKLIAKETDLSKEEIFGSEAAKYMLAWGKKYKSAIGTENYIEKYSAFLNARKEFYTEIGMNIPDSAKKAPELTEDQKNLYRQRLTSFGFSYWEIQLSYKVPGKKAVRTLMFRTLKKPNLDQVYTDLKRYYDVIDNKIDIQIDSAN